MPNALDQVLSIARKNLGGNMESSARLTLKQAIELWDDFLQWDNALDRALLSIKYSVGVYHPDYQTALKICRLAKRGV